MSSKVKAEPKVAILKGQEAEDKVLEYLKRMNRPYGAVDVAANLKGAVPKVATQKILGKTTFFVINQSTIDSVSADALANLETEQKAVDEENKILAIDLRTANLELTKLKMAPSDHELDIQIGETSKILTSLSARLQPLRSGAPLISEAELVLVNAEWTKWRAEWIKRKKVSQPRLILYRVHRFWQLATDALPPQDAASLAEDLGVELDGTEHTALEGSPLCLCPKTKR
ncbi:TBPIP-domain-containing protein [Lyophyllum atratum]|nr:TBPIP-domain-containing protein [Lyophyllum atratum]